MSRTKHPANRLDAAPFGTAPAIGLARLALSRGLLLRPARA
jgi:hypothetical protein